MENMSLGKWLRGSLEECRKQAKHRTTQGMQHGRIVSYGKIWRLTKQNEVMDKCGIEGEERGRYLVRREQLKWKEESVTEKKHKKQR